MDWRGKWLKTQGPKIGLLEDGTQSKFFKDYCARHSVRATQYDTKEGKIVRLEGGDLADLMYLLLGITKSFPDEKLGSDTRKLE